MDKKELEEFKLQEDFSKQIGDYNNNEIVNLQICRPLIELYKNPDKRIKGNTPSGDFWEILNAHINLNPFQPFLNIFRDFKKDYLEKEHKWYLSQSLSVNGYMDGIKIWDFCSSKDGKKMINSNYGNLVFSDENGNQFDYCLNRLKYNKETREAMIIFTRPSIQWECEEHGKHDFICTNYYHFFIRENKLEMILSQRSCDSLTGVPYDFAWSCYVYQLMYSKLLETYPDLNIGLIHWNIDSLHIYERSEKTLLKWCENNNIKI